MTRLCLFALFLVMVGMGIAWRLVLVWAGRMIDFIAHEAEEW